jgi:hypothetical protein
VRSSIRPLSFFTIGQYGEPDDFIDVCSADRCSPFTRGPYPARAARLETARRYTAPPGNARATLRRTLGEPPPPR